MSLRNFSREFSSKILRKFLSAASSEEKSFGQLRAILIVRPHNQFGDMLASVSLLRAVKETYPECRITLIASPENYHSVVKNEFVDELFVFDKKKLINPNYYLQFKKVLSKKYDLAIVPVTVAVSATSCILAGLANAKFKIGPRSLNGEVNRNAFVFTHSVDLNWKKCPDAHVSDFILDLVRPFGIKTKNYGTSISFTSEDIKFAEDFIKQVHKESARKLIGFHIGAGKTQNKWPLQKFFDSINSLKECFDFDFYFTGSGADKDEIKFMKERFASDAGFFIDNTITQLAALISLSDLFITNDTGVMHVAGATSVSQISLFGPTNPFNWAPVGPNKYFIRKSDLINDIAVEDLVGLVKYILGK